MTTQQLPTSLPPGWESDYDGTSERWFFVHRPTGFSQFFCPKAGDENTRIAELAQPQPTNASLNIKMEAMTISENPSTDVPNPQPSTATALSNTQIPPPVQAPTPPRPLSVSQQSQSPSQSSPLARSIGGSIQRKAILRRDSVQSQSSTISSQNSAQPTQQSQVLNSPTQSSTTYVLQNGQNTQPGRLCTGVRK